MFDSFDVYARYRMQQADGKEGKRHRESAREEYKCGNEINKERAWRALVQLMQRLFPTIWLPQLSKKNVVQLPYLIALSTTRMGILLALNKTLAAVSF